MSDQLNPEDSTDVGEPVDEPEQRSCGCPWDYHLSDCPIRTAYYEPEPGEWYDTPWYEEEP